VDGVLVIALGADLRLQVLPPDRVVTGAGTGWPPAPRMGGLWQYPLRRALALGRAICTREDVEIGYRKAEGKRPHALIVGCGARKAAEACEAAALYTGPLFVAARRHAEASGLPWRILSAEHALVQPDTVLEPYDHRLVPAEVPQLGARLVPQLEALAASLELGGLAELRLELHAGRLYAEALQHAGAVYSDPLQGLQVGQRLQWYKRRASDLAEVRRLRQLAPRADGLAVTAHDLDRDAPRTFRLDRIAWVRQPSVAG
jgi:hypothetical protein